MQSEAIREQLARILRSERFAQASRPANFLRFVVERSLEGRPETIKEYVIATEVLGCGPDYNPQVDSTVRAHASRLRARLTEYYATEGAADPVVIRLPKGAYVPEFEMRPPPSAEAPPKTMRGWWLAGSVLALAGLAFLAAAVIWLGDRSPATPGRTGAGEVKSLAVLPFVGLIGTEPEAKTAAILSQKVTAMLGDSGLRIVGGPATLRFQSRALDLMETGRQLAVDAVLTGSVQRSGERLVVTAQLVGVSDGVQIWATVAESVATDALKAETEVSSEIAGSLMAHFRREGRYGEGARNPSAMALYLRAHELIAGDPWTSVWSQAEQRKYEESIRLFEQATREAPAMAAAWVELADALRRLASLQPEAPPDLMRRARSAVGRALEIDPVSARGRWVRARISMFSDYDLVAAERDFVKSIEINPFEGEALMEYADLLFLTGRENQAIDEVSRVLEKDPALPQPHIALGLYNYYVGDSQAGLREASRALGINNRLAVGLWLRALCFAQLGQQDAAESALNQALEMSPNDRRIRAHAAYWYGRTGRAAQARQIAEDMLRTGQRGRNAEFVMALVAAAKGDRDEAFHRLRKSREKQEASFVYLPIENRLRSLARDPRFAELAGTIRGAKLRND